MQYDLLYCTDITQMVMCMVTPPMSRGVKRFDATMFPPAVVEQQTKLGVSAEDSKAQRLKRQQARFRDRGGSVSVLVVRYAVDSPKRQRIRAV